MTDDNVTDLIRSMISESSAKYWTDAEITLYKTMAMNKLLTRWGPWLYHEQGTFEDFGTTASTATKTLPTNCDRVAWILNKEDGDKLHYIQPDELFKYRSYDSGQPVAWHFKAGDINWLPTPTATDSDIFEIHYLPILDAVTEFPEFMRPLIVIESVMLAKYKDENVGPDIFEILKKYELSVQHAFAMSQREPVIFCDYSDEDAYE